MPSPVFPAEAKSMQVMVRFCLRLLALGMFAGFGTQSFAASLGIPLGMTAVLATIAATLKRERFLDASLTHWDEAAAYSALYCLVHAINGTLQV